MVWLRVLIARIKGLFVNSRHDRELNDELEVHLEMLVEEKRRQGLSEEEAQRAARLRFGGISQTEELYRETRSLQWVETLLQDLRYALRILRRNPGFAAVVVLSLALGIGANTAIFSAIDAVMLRMLPVQDPEQLMMLKWHSRAWPDKLVADLEGSSFRDQDTGVMSSYSIAYPHYQQLRDQSEHVFSDTFAFAANTDQVNVGIAGHSEDAEVQAVSGNYFAGLRVNPAVGRMLLSQDDQEGAAPVAVVSYGFWQRRLGASPDISGKTVVINGTAFTVVGVTPPEFFGLEPGDLPDFYTTLNEYAKGQARQGNFNNGVSFTKDPRTWWVTAVGRLQPGITQAQAQAELEILFGQQVKIEAAAAGEPNLPMLDVAPIDHGLDSLRRRFSTPLMLLMGMVGLVLLIACGNVASLLLTRATARQREIALRLSLGARRSRLIRQLLTESVLLALMGGLLGLLVAKWAGNVLLALLASGRNPVTIELYLDSRILAFTAGVSVISGVLFGLVPAWRATRPDLLPALKQSSQGATSAKAVAGRLLVGGQVALCLLLLVGAGLMLRTLHTLKKLDIGFDRENLLIFTTRPGLNGYKDQRLESFYQEMQRRLQAIPGVRSATFSDRAPIGQGAAIMAGSIPGYTAPGKRVNIWRHMVGPGYFSALGIEVAQGRPVGQEDGANAPKAVAVNQEFVRKYFHGDNPLGHQIDFGNARKQDLYEVVGVVRDVKYAQLRQDIPPTVYFSYLQRNAISNFMTFEVRNLGGDASTLVATVRREALALDKDVPLVGIKTESEAIDQVLYLERTFAALSSSFGFLALVLACIGLYGTMAYAVTRRTNEIGIRMALGAERGRILSMILRETLLIVAGGLIVGAPAAWVSSKVLKDQLFGLSPHDPATLGGAILALLAVSLLAGYLPARRASRVDPMVALRYE